jgi:hypothetical protein
MICVDAAPAHAAYYGTAVIDGRSAGKVHLRESPSASSNSRGLYFSGTNVICDSDPSAEWTMVTIGSESGWMKSEFLYHGTNPNSIASRQPTAIVNNRNWREQTDGQSSGWLPLFQDRSGRFVAAERIPGGAAVTILGETREHWYYIKVGDQHGDLYGYMPAENLLIGDYALSDTSQDYVMLYYTEAPNSQSSIKIQYPQFIDESLVSVNRYIYGRVYDFAQYDSEYYSDDNNEIPITFGLTLDYKSEVTLQNDEVVSVVFWGTSNIENSIHPFTDLISYNIGLDSLNIIKLTDLYTINDAFMNVLFNKAYYPTYPVTSDYAPSFTDMLAYQSEDYKRLRPYYTEEDAANIVYFLKPDGVVISMPAVHATGSDHFEAQLRYGDIQQFELDAINRTNWRMDIDYN